MDMTRLILTLIFLIPLVSFSQETSQDSTIFISGKVTDVNGRPIPDLLVVNRSSGRGVFGEADGSYLIKCRKEDEIQIGGLGYSSQTITYRDSTYKPQYTYNTVLLRLQINVPEAQVIAPRELREIIADINTLGYEEKDYRTSGINALESPITFLYESFSKKERSKREVIELENRDKRRELLKELFVKYVEYDIIQLEDDEFDRFVTFMDPGDEMLQLLSQYEFILYTKDKFEDFKHVRKELNPGDYQYHLDKD